MYRCSLRARAKSIVTISPKNLFTTRSLPLRPTSFARPRNASICGHSVAFTQSQNLRNGPRTGAISRRHRSRTCPRVASRHRRVTVSRSPWAVSARSHGGDVPHSGAVQPRNAAVAGIHSSARRGRRAPTATLAYEARHTIQTDGFHSVARARAAARRRTSVLVAAPHARTLMPRSTRPYRA